MKHRLSSNILGSHLGSVVEENEWMSTYISLGPQSVTSEAPIILILSPTTRAKHHHKTYTRIMVTRLLILIL